MFRSSKPSVSNLPVASSTERLRAVLLPAISGVVALVVYGLTMAPDLTWTNFSADGGELITAVLTSGIPHPPGYPTYLILGRIAALIPMGTQAWRFNLFSAVSAATAVAFLTATAHTVMQGVRHKDIVALAAGLSIAFAPLFWGQAIVTEVYALNAAMLSIFLWSLISGDRSFSAGLFLGLAITTHLSSLILMPLAFVLTPRRQWPVLVAGFVLGLIPWLILPVLARSDSPVMWGNPTTIDGWLWLISGRLYYANLRLVEIPILLSKIGAFAAAILVQLAWAGWLIIVLGITTHLLERRTTLALLITSLLYFVYTILYQTDDVVVNLLPILILLCPLLAAGMSRFGSWSVLLPIALLLFNLQTVSLHNESFVRPHADKVLNAAPQNAVLMTPGDHSIFALWYLHHVEERRDDLVLVDANLLAFDWYRQRLSEQYPDLTALEKDDLTAFREQNGRFRPVCDVPGTLIGPVTCPYNP